MRPNADQIRQRITQFEVEYVQDPVHNPAIASVPLTAGFTAYVDNPVIDQPWPLNYLYGTDDWWLWWIGVFRAAGAVP